MEIKDLNLPAVLAESGKPEFMLSGILPLLLSGKAPTMGALANLPGLLSGGALGAGMSPLQMLFALGKTKKEKDDDDAAGSGK